MCHWNADTYGAPLTGAPLKCRASPASSFPAPPSSLDPPHSIPLRAHRPPQIPRDHQEEEARRRPPGRGGPPEAPRPCPRPRPPGGGGGSPSPSSPVAPPPPSSAPSPTPSSNKQVRVSDDSWTTNQTNKRLQICNLLVLSVCHSMFCIVVWSFS
jgi:hypothetical protein